MDGLNLFCQVRIEIIMSPKAELFMPNEQIVKVIWPSITAWATGRWIGLIWGRALAKGPIVAFCVGLFLAPLAALVYFWRLRPRRCRRYIVTNQRIVVAEGILPRVIEEAPWSEITRMELVTHPGQAALRAGDVHVYASDRILLRLRGVSLVENFLHMCRQTQQACLTVPTLRQIHSSPTA
ncbi:MAG: PH domain-containing protein [Thermogutta sp.]